MRTKALCLLACLIGALGACTDDEPSTPSPASGTPQVTLSPAPNESLALSPDPYETPCGSIEPMEGADISEREAIDVAFGRRQIESCDRFEVELKSDDGTLIWVVRLGPKDPYGCTFTKEVDAMTGDLSLEMSVGCP